MAVTIESIQHVTRTFTFDKSSVKQGSSSSTVIIHLNHGNGSVEDIRLDPEKLHKIFEDAYLRAKKVR